MQKDIKKNLIKVFIIFETDNAYLPLGNVARVDPLCLGWKTTTSWGSSRLSSSK